MSVTIVNSPPAIYPAFSINGNPVLASSTLSADTNMKFVFDLYVQQPSLGTQAGTFTKIHRAKIWKNPNDNLGHYSPNELLCNYVLPVVNPFITSTAQNTSSIRFYKIIYGEDYTTLQPFQSTSNNGGLLQLNFSPALTGVTSGDEVQIRLTNNNFNPSYNGMWTATTDGGGTLTVNCPYGNTPATPEAGYVDRILKLNSTQLSGISVFNATKDYLNYNTNYPSTYMSNGSGSKFLTNHTGSYKIGTNEPATLSFIFSGSNISKYVVKTYDSAGAQVGDFDITVSNSGSKRMDIPVGTWNLSQMSATNNLGGGTMTIFSGNVASYTVTLYNTSTVKSETKTYIVQNNCSKYGKIRFGYVNRVGGAEYFTANKKQTYSQKIRRETYDKVLPYNYTAGDRSRTVINVDIDEVYTVFTDFLTDTENVLIRELKGGYEAFIIDTDNLIKIPIIILTNEFNQRNQVNDKLFNYKITYQMAHDLVTQFN